MAVRVGAPPAGSWSVPAPQASSPPPAAPARSAEYLIRSLAWSQPRPMPRCAVSIASATPNPCAHRWSRKASVDSQSMVPSGKAATCGAA